MTKCAADGLGCVDIVKYVHVDHDFAQRSNSDIGCLSLRVWRSGLMDAAPDAIDHAVVGVASGLGRCGWGAAILMRDVAADLVPDTDGPVPEAQHLGFLDHLALVAARLWGWEDDAGLLPDARRWYFLFQATMEAERDLGWPGTWP